MTIEEAQRASQLMTDLRKNLDEQHKLILDVMDIMHEYQTFLLEQLKKARDNV